MEFPKSAKDRLMIGIVAIVLLIHIGTYLSFRNTFWSGLAGMLSAPFLYAAFLTDIHAHQPE